MDAFEQQIAELQRRRQVGAQGAGFNAPQGKMVSGRYVKANPLEYLAEALRGAGQSRDSVMAGEEMGALQDKRQKAIADALRGFQSELNPSQAGTGGTGMVNDALPPEMRIGAQPQLPPRQPNMQAAFGHLMNSNIGSLQSAGMTGMLSNAQEQAKLAREQALHQQHMKILEQTKGNPQAAAVAGVPDATIKSFYEAKNYGRDKVKYENAGGSLIPVTEYGQPTNVPSIPMTGNPFKDLLVAGPDGKPVVNEPMYAAKSRIANAGAARNSTTVINAGPKAFETELGKLDAGQLEKWRDNAQTAQNMLGTVANLRDAEKSGAYSGGGADTRLAVSNMIEGWTGIAPKGLVGSQIYNAEANKLILDRVKTLGANPSNADREFIQKTVPQLATSSAARKQMADWMEEKAVKTIKLYKKADAYARQNSGLKGFNDIGDDAPSQQPEGIPTQDAIKAEIERRRKK